MFVLPCQFRLWNKSYSRKHQSWPPCRDLQFRTIKAAHWRMWWEKRWAHCLSTSVQTNSARTLRPHQICAFCKGSQGLLSVTEASLRVRGVKVLFSKRHVCRGLKWQGPIYAKFEEHNKYCYFCKLFKYTW